MTSTSTVHICIITAVVCRRCKLKEDWWKLPYVSKESRNGGDVQVKLAAAFFMPGGRRELHELSNVLRGQQALSAESEAFRH